MTEENQHPPLGDTSTSKMLRIGASAAGALPFAGSIIQTVLTEAIPNVRLQRAESYIRHLQDQVDEIKLKIVLEKPEGLDLFEEGLMQSVRAFSDDRKKYIMSLVVDGLNEKHKYSKIQYYLRLLQQLGDDDIARLYEEVKWHKENTNPSVEEKSQRLESFSEYENSRRYYLSSFGLIKNQAAWDAIVIDGPTEVCKELINLIGIYP